MVPRRKPTFEEQLICQFSCENKRSFICTQEREMGIIAVYFDRQFCRAVTLLQGEVGSDSPMVNSAWSDRFGFGFGYRMRGVWSYVTHASTGLRRPCESA